MTSDLISAAQFDPKGFYHESGEHYDAMKLFPEHDLEFFILFSFTWSAVGHDGQSKYNAGCMFMAELAKDRRKRGLAASVIHIGLIVGVRYVARTESAVKSLIANAFQLLSELFVHELFTAAVRNGRADSDCQTMMTTGLQKTDIAEFWVENPRFSHLIEHKSTSTTISHETVASVPTRTQLDLTTSLDETV